MAIKKTLLPIPSTNYVEVTADTVANTGFFCFMSKKKSEGYARKLRWLTARFAEGMRIRMLELPQRGFIEYTPGEYAWRAIQADGYMVIHCLWVVGKSKGCGLGKALLETCIADARKSGMKGVAMVTSEKVWLADKRLLEKCGFACIATAEPSFSLMVLSFGKYPNPVFAGDWDAKAAACGKGLTIIRSDQCPYIVDATATALAAADKAGIQSRIIELSSRKDIVRLAPSPYGVFSLVLNGRLLSYHYLLEKDLAPLLATGKR